MCFSSLRVVFACTCWGFQFFAMAYHSFALHYRSRTVPPPLTILTDVHDRSRHCMTTHLSWRHKAHHRTTALLPAEWKPLPLRHYHCSSTKSTLLVLCPPLIHRYLLSTTNYDNCTLTRLLPLSTCYKIIY